MSGVYKKRFTFLYKCCIINIVIQMFAATWYAEYKSPGCKMFAATWYAEYKSPGYQICV